MRIKVPDIKVFAATAIRAVAVGSVATCFNACVYFTSLVNHGTIRHDTRCYFNVRSKADMSRLNLPHGDDS